jgi:hypothetical protein
MEFIIIIIIIIIILKATKVFITGKPPYSRYSAGYNGFHFHFLGTGTAILLVSGASDSPSLGLPGVCGSPEQLVQGSSGSLSFQV